MNLFLIHTLAYVLPCMGLSIKNPFSTSNSSSTYFKVTREIGKDVVKVSGYPGSCESVGASMNEGDHCVCKARYDTWFSLHGKESTCGMTSLYIKNSRTYNFTLPPTTCTDIERIFIWNTYVDGNGNLIGVWEKLPSDIVSDLSFSNQILTVKKLNMELWGGHVLIINICQSEKKYEWLKIKGEKQYPFEVGKFMEDARKSKRDSLQNLDEKSNLDGMNLASMVIIVVLLLVVLLYLIKQRKELNRIKKRS